MRLAAALSRRGHLAIWELEGPYRLDAVEQRWRAALGQAGADAFAQGWPAYRAALDHYNAMLAAGRFCLFRPEDVAALAAQGGFDIEQADPPFYFLRKALGAIVPSPTAP